MTTATVPTTSPAEVVTTMLEALESKDVDRAIELLDDDCVWINVSLPTVRGNDSFDWGDIFVSLIRAGAGLISPGLNRRWPSE